jgi:hypothetical protein
VKQSLVLFLLFAVAPMAADPTGKWSGSFKAEGADHNIPQFVILKQQGSTLSGSAGPDASEQYPLENGRVDGNNVSFQVTTGEWKFSYSLTVEKDSLSGDLKLESTTQVRNAKVTLTRVKGQ